MLQNEFLFFEQYTFNAKEQMTAGKKLKILFATDIQGNSMTLPNERTRSLLWAGGFLIELARDQRLPVDVRRQAIKIARHFPTIEDVGHMAAFRHSSGFGVGLATPHETQWEEGCPCGPLRHSTRFDWPE
jgi:hypothetical protein